MTREPIWRRLLRFHGPDPRADVRDEFAFHLEERAEAFMARGLPAAEARARALERFGDYEHAAAVCSAIGTRRVRRHRWRDALASVLYDLRYAAHGMRRSPGFTAAAVLTIALGIGGNTAVFSILNALLLQPLDARDPGALVRVYTSQGRAIQTPADRFAASSYADFTDLARSKALAGLAAHTPIGTTVRFGDELRRFEGRIVSAGYFDVLGRPPLIGGWHPRDGALETIVSHRFWETQLDRDSSAVGRTLVVNGRTARIAGITPQAFKGIEPSTVDLYCPCSAAAEMTGRPGALTDRGERSVRLIGRLAPGVDAATAERSLNDLMAAISTRFPASNAMRVISVRPASSIVPLELAGDAVLPTAALVFGATLVMLAVAGVNVAAVLLARAIRRRRELAVRLSLGASPLRLVRQLVSESVLLALVAGALVLVILSYVPALAEGIGVPPTLRPAVDLPVLAYAIGVALASGIVFALAPAFITLRSDVVTALRTGESDSRPRARAQRILVVTQLALSMVLLTVGGALLGSLHRQQRTDPGFVSHGLVVAQFEDPLGIQDPVREQAFTRLAVERITAIPGVKSVSLASMAPLSGDGMRSSIRIPGYAGPDADALEIPTVTSGPALFSTLGIPIRSGRELSWNETDTAPRVVINESMARRYWGSRDPVGTSVRLWGREATVVAVSADARFLSLDQPPVPTYVVQRATGGGATLLVRAAGEAGGLPAAIRGAMARGDVPFILTSLRTMDEVVDASLITTRAVTATLMAIGALAILLATLGLYGVVSYVTTGRTREFGVRLALGASRRSISRLVLGYGLRMAAIGGIAGTLLGLGAIRALGGMVFGIRGSATVIAAVWCALCAVAMAACALPAARAVAIPPASALRSE